MINESKTGRAKSIDECGKGAWSRPALTRIQASEAEVFTRVTTDGGFTTS